MLTLKHAILLKMKYRLRRHDSDETQEIESILSTHRIDASRLDVQDLPKLERKKARELVGHVNHLSFLEHSFAFVHRVGSELGITITPAKELETVTTDGDTAVGFAGEQPVRFVRVGQRWFMRSE